MVPALAVADALRARGAEVSFLGTRDRLEADLVPRGGYELDHLRGVRALDRRNPAVALGAAAMAAAAAPAAGRVLRRRGADAVMGGGGYVAGPAGLAALASRVPLVLTEADSRLGLANRILARGARRVCLAFPIPGLEGGRYVVTGRPVPEAVLHADRGAARRRFGIDPAERCLLVFGGSLGARRINDAALDAFAGVAPREFHVLHITGRRDYEAVRERLGAEGERDRYTLIEFEPSLGDALAASDLVVARSGGSVFELAAAGRPAILVPYPHAAGGHQWDNASWMAESGAAVVIEDFELTSESLGDAARALLDDPERLERMSVRARGLARPDAAERVAAEILAVAG